MIRLSAKHGRICVIAGVGDLAPRQESQLAYWGFRNDMVSSALVCDAHDLEDLLSKLARYFSREKIPYDLDEDAELVLRTRQLACSALDNALDSGRRFKDGSIDNEKAREFREYLRSNIARTLKPHQFKAALHLLQTQNAANFSVPGSGKTAVVLAVFERLRQLGNVDSLFVVGPPACFGPWQTEDRAVLGREADCEILAGVDIESRRSKYLVNANTVADMYLTTFQTLERDWEGVQILFERQSIRFFLVVDEAHYIKQLDGAWANAVLNVARHAVRRCILTGTPFPRQYSDAFNLFDVLWPQQPPIASAARHRIAWHTERNELQSAAGILDGAIGPLFYRVRKEDLGLAPQVFHEAVRVPMKHHERRAYDAIIGRVRKLSELDSHKTIDLLFRLRRGRMIRLRQCLSYALLLGSAIDEYEEDLAADDLPLSELIRRYDELETPGKLEPLLGLVSDLREQDEKVVIWSNFVRTLKLLRDKIASLNHGVRLIYGATPIHQTRVRDELTREQIIREFCDPTSGVDVLVANPAACAESISLHKTCSHAIYYDLSYNCAQYLQSLDRIHRVGGSENKPSHYHVLQYKDTIDQDILANIQQKAARMSAIVDRDYAVYSLDMFAEDEEQEAYERLFGHVSG